jgi:uncharacterized phage protein (TIGR02218 family)
MKTPWYETSPGATTALLATRQFVDIDCYWFKLAGAPLGISNLFYSAGPIGVAAGGFTWTTGPTFDQDKAKAVGHWKVGLDVDQWQVVIAPRNVDLLSGQSWPDSIGTQPWLAAAQAGALDGAEVQVDRAFAPLWPVAGTNFLSPTGVVTIFYGRVAELDVGRSQAVMTLNSTLKVLTNPLPRNLFQASCVHTLFDQGCTLQASSFAVAGTVTSSSGSSLGSTVAAPAGSGTFALGRIVMVSGASAGFARLVRSWVPGTFTLAAPFPFGTAPGDGFLAYPGCDKQYGTCGRFQNTANFGGCLSIPVPETAV